MLKGELLASYSRLRFIWDYLDFVFFNMVIKCSQEFFGLVAGQRDTRHDVLLLTIHNGLPKVYSHHVLVRRYQIRIGMQHWSLIWINTKVNRFIVVFVVICHSAPYCVTNSL